MRFRFNQRQGQFEFFRGYGKIKKKKENQNQRNNNKFKYQKESLKECLLVINDIRKLDNQSGAYANPAQMQELLLLEFRTKCLMKDPNLGILVDSFASMPPKDFGVAFWEKLAACCRKSHPLIFMHLLKKTLTLHLSQPTVDYDKCSKLFRLLIEQVERNADFEAFQAYFEEISKIIQGLDKGKYPTIELEWLLVKAWNQAVLLLRWLKYKGNNLPCPKFLIFIQMFFFFRKDAEKWMSKAIQFNNKLPTEIANQYQLIQSKYAQLLLKIEETKNI